jgi:hypothetical protein
MNTEEITGGVSPLKKKWKGTASRTSGQKRSIKGKLGGAAGIRNTSTRKGRRGFSKTGAKGSNVHGYGVLTRFKPIATKDYAGPLAAATTPKSGSSGGGGGGGGAGSIYNIDQSIRDSFNKEMNQYNNRGDAVITRETTTSSEKKLEGYDEFWEKRIGDKSKWSKGMKQYLKNVDMDDPDAVKKARAEWDKVSRANAHKRNKDRKNSTTTITTKTSGGDGDGNSSGNTMIMEGDKNVFKNTGLKYDPAKRLSIMEDFNNESPNKMKSHAWNMLQKQKKARGGTQKY